MMLLPGDSSRSATIYLALTKRECQRQIVGRTVRLVEAKDRRDLMPTYEYSCKSCGEHLEVVQSFKDDALTECPNCGGDLRKVFGNIGIVFKGSGFYKNDSRSGQFSVKPAAAVEHGSEVTAPAASSEPSKPAASEGARPRSPPRRPHPRLRRPRRRLSGALQSRSGLLSS